MREGENVVETPADGTNVVAWVVKRNGSAAWTTVAEESPQKAVWRAQATNVFEREQLEAATDIDPASLRLSAARTTITWIRGGEPRSAPID
jgi:hypothetical protein